MPRLQKLKMLNFRGWKGIAVMLCMGIQFILAESYWSPLVKSALVYIYVWLQPLVLMWLSASKNIKVFEKALPAYSIVSTLLICISIFGRFRNEALYFFIVFLPQVLYISILTLSDTNVRNDEEMKSVVDTIMFTEDYTKIIFAIIVFFAAVYYRNWLFMGKLLLITISILILSHVIFCKFIQRITSNRFG